MQVTIADVAALYAEARAVAQLSVVAIQPGVCRYCGKWWRSWVGENQPTLDGHARCVVTKKFQSELTALWWRTPALTIQQIADACQVSVAVASVWLGRRRRK